MAYTVVRILQTFERIECRQEKHPRFRSDIVCDPPRHVSLKCIDDASTGLAAGRRRQSGLFQTSALRYETERTRWSVPAKILPHYEISLLTPCRTCSSELSKRLDQAGLRQVLGPDADSYAVRKRTSNPGQAAINSAREYLCNAHECFLNAGVVWKTHFHFDSAAFVFSRTRSDF